jgi:thiamine kinase-like enzyme
MNEVKKLLELPLGKSLAEGNWESYVYELGDDWVYKEIKQPSAIDEAVSDYKSRQILQTFWNSEVHFQNMIHDYQVFKSKLTTLIPETFFLRQTSLLDQSLIVTISIQKKLNGTLCKDIDNNTQQLKELAIIVRELCEQTFNAPPDFHPGNLLLTDDGKLFFFDTGTPSDWDYFLDPKKMVDISSITSSEANKLTEFMKPIHEKHWQKLIDFSEN